jgi:hypothetical protein
MVNYQCYRCGYSTNHKTKIRLHINRKNTCEPKLNNLNLDVCKDKILQGLSCDSYMVCLKNAGKNTKITLNNTKNTKNNEFNCKYCEKIYSRTDSLNRHLKICKEKKKDDEVKQSMSELVKLLNKKLEEKDKQLEKQNIKFDKELEKRDKELEKRDKELEKQLSIKDKHIEELIKKAGINNNTINVQNNIKLLSYSDTDRSHLTDNDILKCLKHSNFCIPHLIEKIHFDINKPENHNLYISNLKNKYVMMYDGNKWECKDRDEQINNLIDDNEGIIEYKLEEWIENGVKYPEMMRKFNRYIEKKDNDKVINKIKDEIKLLLYNNRNIVSKEGVKSIEIT